MPQPRDSLIITTHCLLRLTTALMLESQGLDHALPTATGELNRLTGRSYPAGRWLEILEPYYQARFDPGPRDMD